MNVINIEHVSKVFGDKVIFDDVSFGIHQNDKIGIIGINGTGKSTLLKMIAREEEPEEGEIITQNNLHITYLPQNPEFPPNATVLSYTVSGEQQEDWVDESSSKNILNKLGILDHEAVLETLSGGQRKRVALARTLLVPSDVLILDEPTNHLDHEMVTWLEEYLRQYRGVVIMVTHDRYFLDKVTNKILEISHGKLYSYKANYSEFLELKAEREEMELATQRKQNSVLRMELEWAKRGCRARTTKQKARLQRLELLKAGKAPAVDERVELESVETRMGKKTIELEHLMKSYGERCLINDFSYIFLRNQRIGIIGPNGCGKSTLLKMIEGEVLPDSGTVTLGETIKIGYFAQEEPDMNTSQRVIDYIRDVAEYIPTKDGHISASQMLERFLFDAGMQYTPITKLSGGEKRRLYLLKVLMTAPNVLILDEPTNNLDIPTLTILEDYIDTFAGIIITVSHDRYFLDEVADRLFAFEENGHLQQYEGGYTDYLDKRAFLEESKTPARKQESSETEKTAAKSWKKKDTKLKFTFKEQKEYDVIDDEIAVLEEKIEKVETEIEKFATNSGKLNELMKEKEELETALEEKMDRWVYLNDLAEKIANQ